MITAGEPLTLERDTAALRRLAWWITLSIALHAVLLMWHRPLDSRGGDRMVRPPLTVTLQAAAPPAPEPAYVPPPPAVAAPATPRAQPRPPRPAAAPHTPPAPPARPREMPPPLVMAEKPAPAEAPVAASAPRAQESAAAASPAPVEGDLAAYVEARRRARGDIPAATDERSGIAAAQSSGITPFAAPAPRAQQRQNGYGTFEIRRRSFDYAEYVFRGWNENFRRDGLELIEVRKGDHANIDIAVIRSIIQVIRRTENAEFWWTSHRLGRSLILSAHARDTASLEAFLLKEFAEDLLRPR